MSPHAERGTRVLFVDDEPNIRLTLPRILKGHGFEVTTAGNVAEALVAINSSPFDVLLSDLNIGEEGNGFLIVTAMRHVQPNCLTVILTGYPAFETALAAIRHQVDDYLVKPMEVEGLVATLRAKLAARDERSHERKTMAALLGENLPLIVARLPEALKASSERPFAREDERGYLGRLPVILDSLWRVLETGSEELPDSALDLAAEHGVERRNQGYRASAIITDFEVVHTEIYKLVESRLLTFDAGALVADLRRVERALYRLAKHSIASYEDSSDQRISA